MNWDQIEANWKQLMGSARAHWGKLTDDDWQQATGKREHLVGLIQERYGIAREDAEKWTDEWSRALLDVEREVLAPSHRGRLALFSAFGGNRPRLVVRRSSNELRRPCRSTLFAERDESTAFWWDGSGAQQKSLQDNDK